MFSERHGFGTPIKEFSPIKRKIRMDEGLRIKEEKSDEALKLSSMMKNLEEKEGLDRRTILPKFR